MRLLRRRGGAVATYAAVLDGAHLWLEVEGDQDSTVAVRETGTRQVTGLGPAPHDLTVLTGTTYEVLVDGAPVGAATLPGDSLTRTPLAPDGRTRWELVAGEALRLVRRTEAATAELDAVDVRGARVHLRLRPAHDVRPGEHLLLLDTDDQVRSTVSVTAHDGLLEALLGEDDLPPGHVGVLRVAVGTESSWVRVRRRGNDLADPHHAVLLPELPGARLRWNPDGLLALRVLDGDERP